MILQIFIYRERERSGPNIYIYIYMYPSLYIPRSSWATIWTLGGMPRPRRQIRPEVAREDRLCPRRRKARRAR